MNKHSPTFKLKEYILLLTPILVMMTACNLETSKPLKELGLQSHPKSLSIPKRVVAVPRVATYLVRGLLQQARSGQKLDFQPSYHVDQALKALNDGLILAAFHVDSPSNQTGIPVAQSEIWLATRNHHGQVSVEQWQNLLSGKATLFPDGTPFQLCLRQQPDVLEYIWLKDRPTDQQAFSIARKSGRWPIFDNDQTLLDYLSSHPGSVALFTKANLKLMGAPLTQVSINPKPSVSVQISLHLAKDRDLPKILQNLIYSLKSIDRITAVEEWGWAE